MKEKINTLWENLREVNNIKLLQSKYKSPINLDPDEYRIDDLGAIIKKSEYGNQTEFGWTIDHMFPLSKGGDDNIRNLQLLHWKNNELKGDDFPTFSWDTSINLDGDRITNDSKLRIRATFTGSFVDSLSDIYPNIMQYWVSPLEQV
ncbi:MAG: hypothetical protein RLZZ175_2540 [Bacteroidota bacterium]|jgi:hypothetical protein